MALYLKITLSTRITDSSRTLIDNIYSNVFLNNTFSGNIIIEIAYHLLQFVSIDTSKIEYNKDKCYKRNYRNFSEESLRADNYHTKIVQRLVNRHAPIKKLNQKEQKGKQKPWNY